MFIETLEFTIPVDLCDLFSTLKEGSRSNLEFPASVNSYGTTQDASIQVALRANKLTFTVDGVSSNASMISKSECKTLKLSVFDVDRTLIAQECSSQLQQVQTPSPHPSKRTHEYSSMGPSHAKINRTSYSDTTCVSSPQNIPQKQNSSRASNHSQSKPPNDNSVNVKQEPEDPDLIEIDPDPESDDLVPKKESPYSQTDYSPSEPPSQTSQAALDRLSFPRTSQSSPSFHHNVPHVPDYAQPGPSRHRQGDQSADDYLVYQDDNDYADDNDNSADFSNEDISDMMLRTQFSSMRPQVAFYNHSDLSGIGLPSIHENGDTRKRVSCLQCGKMFSNKNGLSYHIQAIHEGVTFKCTCGKFYNHRRSLLKHKKTCPFVTQETVDSVSDTKL